MTSIGICLNTSWQAIEVILGCMQTGIHPCILSSNWPAISVDGALSRLRIKYVLTTRTDLKTRSLDQSNFRANRVNQETFCRFDSNAATIMYTSGSSAHPKAVLHTMNNHIFSAEHAISRLKLGNQDRWLLNLPIWHVSGLSIVFRCLISGAKIVIPDSKASFFESLSAHQITHVSMVATQLIKVMNQPPPACLRAVILGGGPAPIHVLKQAIHNGWPIQTTYGMTETGSMVTLSNKSFTLGTSGHVLQGHELKIASDREILVRSPAICSGYLQGHELQNVTDEDGWLHTGDLGYLNRAGELYVQGRKDHMFISGGENISPEEIEHVLCNFPGVKESIVVPVPDPKFGQRPVAFVRGLSDFAEVQEFLIENLPKYKIPTCHAWPNNITSTSFKRNRKSFSNLATILYGD